MAEAFPPQFPILLSSSSLDALIYASAPQGSATQNRSSSFPPHHFRPVPSVNFYTSVGMLSQDVFRSPRSSLDEAARPPVPPKDWSPNRAHVRSSSSSSQGSTGSPPGSVRRKFSIRTPRPQRSFGRVLDLTLPGSTAANSIEILSPPLSGSPVPCHTPPLATPELLPESKSQMHPDYVDWDADDDDASSVQSWHDLNCVVYKDAIPYHPFNKAKAPYILPYTKTVFEMERRFMDLLLKLLPTESPTFYDYGSRPPKTVLDLGCGKGYWAAYAAKQWKFANSKITAFDLIDLGDSLREEVDPEVAANIFWVRGNFVRRKLPFPDNYFAMVRMANLAMAVPADAWDFLLDEVKRVLKPDGRLEFIGDKLFFPTPPTPFYRQESDHQRTASLNKRAAIYMGNPESLNYDSESRAESARLPDPVTEYNNMKTDAGWLENQFTQMLREVYNIDMDVHNFLPRKLKKVFGYHRETYEGKLYMPWSPEQPPPPIKPARRRHHTSVDIPQSSSLVNLNLNLTRSNSTRSVTKSSEPELPPGTPPKAISRMCGGDEYKFIRRYQPTGLIVGHSTFIPCQPQALDFWACHNMHLLLACGPDLSRFVQNTMSELLRQDFERRRAENPYDPSIEPLQYSESDVCEAMFQYESFKQKRMNLPSNGASFEVDMSERSWPGFFNRARSKSTGTEPLFKSQPKGPYDVHVRTIQVFEARKTAPSSPSNSLRRDRATSF